jgi:hypothetical protein
MKLLRLLPVFALAAACTPAAVEQPRPAPAVEEAVFTVRQGGTEILTERTRRTADRLDGGFALPNGARVEYQAHLRPDASVARLDLRQWEPGSAAGAQPALTSTGTFEGGTAQMSQTRGGQTETAQRDAPERLVVFINPSPALLEQVILRARAMGGERVEVPVWVPSGGGQSVSATVAFDGPEAATVTMGDTQLMARMDARGRLLSASVPAQGVTFERGPGVTP